MYPQRLVPVISRVSGVLPWAAQRTWVSATTSNHQLGLPPQVLLGVTSGHKGSCDCHNSLLQDDKCNYALCKDSKYQVNKLSQVHIGLGQTCPYFLYWNSLKKKKKNHPKMICMHRCFCMWKKNSIVEVFTWWISYPCFLKSFFFFN